MKKLYIFLLLLSGYNLVFGQQEAEVFKVKQIIRKDLEPTELSKQFFDADLSKIWTKTDNQYVYGFIGDDFQRIRVKIISVTRSRNLPGAYEVYGKSMVKGNVDEFKGEMQISNIRKLVTPSPAMAKYYKQKGIKGEYVLLGDYVFKENKNEKHSGVFKGVMQAAFYVDKNNKPQYDDLNKVSDSFTNNQFIGQWVQYNANEAKRCNWGDYRIPNAGDFDTGAGEFSPADKYLKAGWQSAHDAMQSNNKKAIATEKAVWWK